MPRTALLIKPVSSACNLNCVYCLYNGGSKKNTCENFGIMSLETAETVVRDAFSSAKGTVGFTFCGGEPTMRGLDFFQAFVDYVNKYNNNSHTVKYTINTNGVLLDEEWAIFLAQNNFFVQLSLDGYKELNDLSRVDFKGGGTYNSVIRAITLMKRHNINFGVSCVVNRLTSKYAGKIYNFFKNNDINNLEFIPCLDNYSGKRGKNFYSLTPELYAVFLKELFDKWYAGLLEGGNISIKHFDNWVPMMFGYPADCCHINGVCELCPAIEADGSVYPCKNYVSENWRLGNISGTSLTELVKSEKADAFLNQSYRINNKCNRCKYFKVCRGGCRCHREPVSDSALPPNYYCEAYERFFAYASERLRKIAVLLNTSKLI